MKPEFSEFSYGFAFTDAFIRRKGSLTTAPVFPSLRAERSEGWDVRLNLPGVSYFHQFKLSDRLVRSNATYWKCYGKPYFRIDITPLSRSPQHNLLKDLNDGGEDNVYYVAPFFHTMRQFNDAYLSDQVVERSLQVPVRELKRLDDMEPHHLTFTRTDDFSWHTDEHNLRGHLIAGDFAATHVYDRIQNVFSQSVVEPVTERYFLRLRGLMEEILADEPQLNYTAFETQDTTNRGMDTSFTESMAAIRYYLTTYFGLEMFMIYQEPTTQG